MLRSLILPAVALGAFATPVSAAVLVYTGSLAGANERPNPVASNGSGTATATVDTVANTLRVQVTFAGLTGTTIQSHIHCCVAPSGATIVSTALPSFPNFPLNAQSGSYDQTFDLLSSSTYNPTFVINNGGTAATAEAALIAGLNAGQAYLNIHTTSFTGGEIRANLTAVPEPASWALMLTGFAAAGGTLRIRRRAKARAA